MALAKKMVLLNPHCIYSHISALDSAINPEHQDNGVTDRNKNIYPEHGGKKIHLEYWQCCVGKTAILTETVCSKKILETEIKNELLKIIKTIGRTIQKVF